MKKAVVAILAFLIVVCSGYNLMQPDRQMHQLAENIHVEVTEELEEYPIVNLVDNYRNFDDMVRYLGVDYEIENSILKIIGEPNGKIYDMPSSDAVPASYTMEGPVYQLKLKTEYGEALDALYHEETLYLRLENFERVHLLRGVGYDFDTKTRVWSPKEKKGEWK